MIVSRTVWSRIFCLSIKSVPPIFLEVADVSKNSQEGNPLCQGLPPQGMALSEGGEGAVCAISGYLILQPPCQPQAASASLLSLTLNVHGSKGRKSLTEVPETQS